MIVGAFVIAAVVTPPDVVSQLMLAVPMCLLYELGIFPCPALSQNGPMRSRAAESVSLKRRGGVPDHRPWRGPLDGPVAGGGGPFRRPRRIKKDAQASGIARP